MILTPVTGTIAADGTSTTDITARYVDGTGTNTAAPSDITVALGASPSSVCVLTSTSLVIPSGLSSPISVFGTVRSTTTAGTCNVTGTASGGFTGTVTSTSVITTAADRVVLPAGLLVAPGGTTSFTVSVTGPTPTAPVVVSLSSVNTGIATVLASVTIPAGSSSTSVNLSGVATGSTTIQAAATNYVTATAVVTVKTITMDFSPCCSFTVYATTTTTRQILLSDAAPPGGIVVALAIADTTKATLSASSVVIPAGQLLSPSFTINWVAQGSTTLTATATGITTASTGFSVAAAPAVSVGCYFCYSVGAGMYLPGSGYYEYVALSNPAPAGGLVVTLASSNTSLLTVPSSVTVPAGQTSIGFQANGIAPSVAGPPTITGSATGWASGSRTLTVLAPEIRMYSYNTSKTTLTAPENVTSQLTCSGGSYCGEATSAVAVTYAITAGNTATVAMDNATATIAAGGHTSDSAGVVGTPSTAGTYQITPSATGFTSIDSNAVTVALPSITVTCYYCYNVGAGMYLPGSGYYEYVALSNAAPTGGLVVTLASSDTSLLTVPTSVTVPAGQTSVGFQANGIAPSVAGAPTITASATGWTSGSRTLSVLAPEIRMYSYNTSKTTLTAPENVTSQITCSGGYCGELTNALAVSYAITAGNTATVVMDNATATVAAGNHVSDNAGVVGTPSTGGTYQITPSASGFTSIDSGTVTVSQPSITVTCYFCYNVGAGMYLPGSGYYEYISLSNAAPTGGLIVTLASSDTSLLTVPSSVTVPAGQTSVGFQANGIAPSVAGAPTITASATGWTSGSRGLSVLAPEIRMYSYTTSKTTLAAPENVTSQLTCSGGYCGEATSTVAVTYAIKAGNTATVVMDSAAATIAAGNHVSDNAGIVGTPSTGGTYQITPSASGFSSVDSAVVTVALPSITVSCYYCYNVGAGLYLPASYYEYVSLSNAAPTGGLVVNLSSTSPSVATVQSTVTVPQGQTVAYFRVDGVVAGVVQIQASASGWSGSSRALTVVQPRVEAYGVNTTRNTASVPDDFGAIVNCGGTFCGNVPSAVTVSFAVTLPSPAGIVSLTSASATIPADSSSVSTGATAGTPTTTGTYAITPTASGFTSTTSSTVTVSNAATIYGSGLLGAGLSRSDLYYVQLNDSVAAATTLTLTSSDPTKVVVTSVTIPAGNSYAYFKVSGIAAGSATVSVSQAGWSSNAPSVTVSAVTLLMTNVTTTRLANVGSPYTFYVNAYCSASYCGTFTTPPTVTAVATPAISAITFTPPTTSDWSVTLSSGVPTQTGTFTITVTLSGFGSVTSPTITVN